jgi:hypothetical protein
MHLKYLLLTLYKTTFELQVFYLRRMEILRSDKTVKERLLINKIDKEDRQIHQYSATLLSIMSIVLMLPGNLEIMLSIFTAVVATLRLFSLGIFVSEFSKNFTCKH